MTDVAIKQLFKIVEMEGVSIKDGRTARKQALKAWIDENIIEVEVENNIIKKNLTSEDEDFIKYYLAHQIGSKLLEDCATVISEKNNIKVKVFAINKQHPKNKE